MRNGVLRANSQRRYAMFPKHITRTPLLLAIVFVLVIFSVPMTSFAGDECPCFTAKDVMRFTPPSPFTCIRESDYQNGLYTDMRASARGDYFAYFSSTDIVETGAIPDEIYCEAYAIVGDLSAPNMVLLGNEEWDETYGFVIHIDLEVWESWACTDLLKMHAKRIGDCNFDD